MDDLISRQAAIDAIKDMYRAAEKWLRDATDDVTKARAESCMASLVEIKLRTEKLPVVQPDHTVDVSKKVEKEDCVSRRAAIDAIGTLSDAIFKSVEKGATYPNRQWFDGMANAESIIKDLPSVHPEIIRCGDCIHYNEYEDCIKYQRDGFCSEWARNTYKYWYCSRAERSVKYE